MIPLQNGDRLTRAEFERRYEAMPHLKKAELIEGVVHVPAPVGFRHHGMPEIDIATWLNVYKAATPGTEAGSNTTLRLDLDNEAQPDVFLRIDPARGGQSRTSEDDFIEGAPELIVEIAASSASYDLHSKRNVYRRNGVLEYIVWRTLDGDLDWFVLREGEYHRLALDPSGRYKSHVFPGLWLDSGELLGGDTARVLAVLQEGIQSFEHGEFVRRLEKAAQGR